MNAVKKIILVLVITGVLLGGLATLYFTGNFSVLYNTAARKLEEFRQSDFGNALINEVDFLISAPSPLNIGGAANNVTLIARQVIVQTNLSRQSNGGLPALQENAELTAAALAKAQDMFVKQYFEHVSPSGVDPGELVKNNGYNYVVTGENLILGNFKDEKEMVQLWMDSPGHRANILNNRYTDIGIAVVKGTYKGETVWIGVQEFGLPLDSCLQPSPNLKVQIENNKDTLNSIALQIETKRAEINATNRQSSKYNQLIDEHNELVAKYNTLNEATKKLITQYNNQTTAFNKCVEGK